MYGDTGVIRRLATQMAEQGTEIRSDADQLVKSSQLVVWEGRAAQAMRERMAERAVALRRTADEHDDAAQALRHHADEVDRLKDLIREIANRVRGLDRGRQVPSGRPRRQGARPDQEGHPRPHRRDALQLPTAPRGPQGLARRARPAAGRRTMNAILLDAQGNEVEQRSITPRRVRLSRAAIDRFAELAAVESPAAQMVVSTGSLDSLGDRLGSMSPDPAPAVEAADPLTTESDLDEALVAASLVEDGAPTVEGRAVLTVWHAPALAVELEMLVALRRGKVRVRSWHRNLDDWVVCLSTGDGSTFELSWLSADDWWLELGRAAHVDTATLSASPYDEPAPRRDRDTRGTSCSPRARPSSAGASSSSTRWRPTTPG